MGTRPVQLLDMPEEDKPDKSTVASVLDSDPLQESVDEAMQRAGRRPAGADREVRVTP